MTPGNDHPEIPSFKPATGKEEDKKGTGIVPSSAKPAPSSGFKFPGFGGGSTGASKAFSAPNLKVRGIGGGGATVMDRLKNLRKKDLIFIAAGLCTLGMAPLAEHLLMSPDEQTAKLQEGFNSQQGPLFQDGSSVYEPGNGVGSPGGLVGSGSDVITPLNVRDPSNLIMSPGAQKKADAVVAPPPTPSAAPKDDSDWKNALSGAARSGASKAAQQAPRPRPNVGKMAGAIRGLSALGGGGGGTGASLKLDPLSASNVPNRAAGSNALTKSQATPGFRGVTARSGSSSGAGEDLRAAGAKQSDIFNKGGGASAALDAASREAIPSGGQGFSGGRPGEGGETKNPGGNSQKDNKSLGESLAFLRQKMEMEKSLDLKWERKKWNEFGRQKMMEESALKLGFDMFGKFAEKAFIGPLGDMIGQSVAGSGAPAWVVCKDPAGFAVPASQLGSKYKLASNGDLYELMGQNPLPTPVAKGCVTKGGGAEPAATPGQYERQVPPKVGAPQSNIAQRAGSAMDTAVTNCAGGQWSDTYCKKLKTLQNAANVQMKAAEEASNGSLKFIQQAYEKMSLTHTEIKKGVDGFSGLLGTPAKAGGAADEKAPFSLVAKAGEDALAAKASSAQSGKLDAAKEGGHKTAAGDGETTCAAAQGGMAAPCAQSSAALNGAGTVQTQLESAEQQLKIAEAEVKSARGLVNDALGTAAPAPAANATAAPATPSRGAAEEAANLQTLGGQVDRALKELETAVTKSRAYYTKANAVYQAPEGSLQALRTSVFGPATTLQGTVEKTAGDSKTLVTTHATQCGTYSSATGQAPATCWYHIGTMNQDSTPPVALKDDFAGGLNIVEGSPLKKNQTAFKGSLEAARGNATARQTDAEKVKKIVDACSANFGCAEGPTGAPGT